jgi:hypothetical protein
MDRKTLRGTLHAAAAAAIILGAAPAVAQLANANKVSTTSHARVAMTVVAIDPATRHITVKDPAGEVAKLKISPQAGDLKGIKPGDKINADYYREVGLAISARGKAPVKPGKTSLAAFGSANDLPAGLLSNRVVVTGAIVGIDMANSRVKLVNPKGGEVHTFDVATPEGKKVLEKLKVGDSITAYVTEGFLISASRG